VHRSWIGYQIYAITFASHASGPLIVRAEANRDPSQYKQTNDEADVCFLLALVDGLIINVV
jgi:hypothetical protein